MVVVSEEVVRSPCISVCVLNAEDICEGCYRSAREITDWTELSNPEKTAVLQLAQERLKRLNQHLLL